MTTFAITSSDQVIGSVNYLLSNLGQSGNVGNITIPTGTLIGNTTTGVVTPYNAGGNVYGYLYQWVNLRYANNATGSSGFSTVPTNSQYFGVFNSTSQAASSNPTDYQWQQVAGGFGTTKTIYYSALGGRQVLFAAANSAPSSNYVVSTANTAIDLDVVTTAAGTPGSRGPIPMGYVITTADPTSASSSVLTGWFQSSRQNPTPPIGTGLTPVSGDTAYFTYPTTGVSETYTFNGSAWNTAVGQVVSGNTVVGNSLPGNAITSSTITATQIAGNTITANQIAANTITATQISSSYLYTGNIISNTATFGSNTSSGYWLRYTDGAARFGGNVSIGNSLAVGANASIGANLTVSGLITTGALVANSVATTTLNLNAATQVLYQGSTTGAPVYGISYFNTTGNIYWPFDTRGFAVPAVAIRPTTSGSTGGSSILITISGGVETNATDNPANLVELWRTGQDVSYNAIWNGVTTAIANNIFTGNLNNMVAVGSNDSLAFSTDGGNTWGVNIGTSTAVNYQQSAAIDFASSGATDTEVSAAALGGVVVNYFNGGGTWFVPNQPFLYDTRMLFVGKDISNPVPDNDIAVLTGASGYISYYRPLAFTGASPPTATIIAVPTGVLSDIRSCTFSNAANANAQVKNAVFVGTGGTVLTNQFTFNSGNANVTNTALTLRSAVTDSNLYGVSSDLSDNVSTAWVSVGEAGAIIRSTNSGTTWTAITSPTQNNLWGVVGYGGDATKRFVAVGDRATILMSSDAGATWAAATVPAPTDGITRNLYSVAFNPNGGTGGAGIWVAVGQGIIYKCDKTSTTWTIAYQAAGTVTSQLQRLIFFGSNANVYDNTTLAVNSIGNSVINYTYQDTNYTDSQTYQYYLVAGNMNSPALGLTVRFPSVTVQEIKR
jgi:cytoskeletal protein CcmA (bactofilin family)